MLSHQLKPPAPCASPPLERFHNTFADPSRRPAAAALGTEDCVHTLPVDRRHMAVGDTDAAADAHMQEGVAAAGDILRNDFAAVGEDSHRLEEVGQGVTDADVVHTRHEVQKGPEEEVDPGRRRKRKISRCSLRTR